MSHSMFCAAKPADPMIEPDDDDLAYDVCRSSLSERRWSPSWIRTLEDGTTIHRQLDNFGYGYWKYMIIGTRENILREYDTIKARYCPMGYGGFYPDPAPLHGDLWIGCPGHSASCD